jgi:hypothetical protein
VGVQADAAVPRVTPVPPPDALIVEVRRIPADARSVFAQHGSLESLDAKLRHPSAAGWSPLQHLTHVVDTLHVTAMWVVAAFDEGREHDAPVHPRNRPAANQAPPRAVLGALDQASNDLATALVGIPTDGWERLVGGGEAATTLQAALSAAVADVHAHLVQIDALLTARG